jgi:inhibitor of KinA sporulation pathway (predicted exonuclease)
MSASYNLSSSKIQYIDLELQCWENGKCPIGQSKHIIQIGLVEIDSAKLKITREERYYIKPNYKNFEISNYCTTLTGITREKILSSGKKFNEVMNTIKNEFSPRKKVTYAWGLDNLDIISHCKKYACINPWEYTGIWDLGTIFQSTYSIKRKLTLQHAITHMNLTFIGRPHDGLIDAINLANLHCEMIRRMRV